MKQTPAHDLANPDLLSLLPDVARVVEVGCSKGALAREYKQRNPESYYVGIEIDPENVEAASTHCDQIILGDIETLLSDRALARLQPADCWVFGDTLEHLRDPWRTLRDLKPHLNPEGYLCACIPNMQHWSIQLRLNTGQLEYSDSGLLDRTHLRWFTRQTMLQLLEGCGFQTEILRPRIFPHQHAALVCDLIGKFAIGLGHDPKQAIEDALPLQYVIRARPH